MPMNDKRKAHLAEEMDGGADITSDFLTVSEISEVIGETALTDSDRRLAELRYVRRRTVQEIASEMNLDERTVRRRLSSISPRLCRTAMRLIYS